MNNYFNIKLYKEGLKKVRLLGIASAMVSILLCGIIPIIHMVESSRTVSEIITIREFAVPLFIILFISPFFVTYMFSYLNDRSKSDFYHSIPYKRICVFLSFTSAALTWIFGIIISSTLITGILWTVDPFVTFNGSVLFLIPLVYILATTMIVGFFTIAMALTGTPASNLAIGLLLMCFFRVTGFLFTVSLNSAAPIFDISYSLGAFLEPRFFLPLAIIGSVLGSIDPSQVYNNTPMLLYSATVAVALLIIGALLYKNRRSEMAGKAAPSRLLQNVYRCAITVPFALALASLLLDNHYDGYGLDTTLVFILLVITLLVYYLYELITTKNVKNMLKATPYLLVVAAVAVAFSLSIALVRSSVLSENYTSEEIASIAFYSREDGYNNSYEDLAVVGIPIDNPEASKIVASALKASIEAIKDNSFYNSYEASTSANYRYISTELKLTSGKVIGRYLKLPEKDYTALMNILTSSKEYQEAYLLLPSAEEAKEFWIMNLEVSSEELWKTFQEEYNTLPSEAKLKVKEGSSSVNGVYLSVSGESKMKRFNSNYLISEVTPKTLEKYLELINSSAPFSSSDPQKRKSKEIVVKYLEDIVAGRITNDSSINGELFISIVYNSGDYDVTDKQVGYVGSSEKEWTTLKDISSMILKDNIDKIDINKPYIVLQINEYNYLEDKENSFNGSAAFNLSEANMEKLQELLNN